MDEKKARPKTDIHIEKPLSNTVVMIFIAYIQHENELHGVRERFREPIELNSYTRNSEY